MVLLLLHTREDLYFFSFAFRHDLQGSLHTNTENTPYVSFKTPYSGWSYWMKNSCLHPKWDWLFQVKKKSLETVFKWKMYAIANIPSAWCPSKKEDYSCLLWHFIKYCVLMQVTWGILQNLFFSFPLSVRNTVEIRHEFVAKFMVEEHQDCILKWIPGHEQWSSERDLQLPQPTFTSWLFCILSYFFTELNCHTENHLSRCFLK